MNPKQIAVVGDLNPSNPSHAATNETIGHCSTAARLAIEHKWIGTEELQRPEQLARLAGFAGAWIAPASPYRSMEGALSAIRLARESGIPLLGTCGGFQHIILEYARNVLGFTNAQHEEVEPQSSPLFISRLACSLVGRGMTITLQPDSLVARAYGQNHVREQYHCNFGVNPEYVDVLRSSALKIVGSDEEGVIRAVELAEHPFFVGTLFLPQLNSSPTRPHPLVSAFIRACSRDRATVRS